MARSRATSTSAADETSRTPAPNSPPPSGEAYTVVARRYRPQRFEDVVGQDHIVQALRNAIRLDRVAQAYLFSGTRGVGKTSMARIFAKCLNCEKGPTESPCNECDICRAIAAGQDVDVIEIDGASNNGVDAVRELRQNASLRPSRARYKIYYIDEVHMLSTGAFNALLKTLEEPPRHVKFFFATTEANRIPITVLSRCQRFDFAPIGVEAVTATLADICQREGVDAEPGALEVVARRAAGSMRDAQSLLEQLLSSGQSPLTADLVHRLLGIAGDERILELLESMADRDLARALEGVDVALGSGVQAGDLLASLLDFLRDTMIVSAGAGERVPLLAAGPAQLESLRGLADRWPIDSILAAQQILAEARGRLRGSTQPRLIAELAVARVARLEHFDDLATLIDRLDGGDAPARPNSSSAPVAATPRPAAEPVKKKEAVERPRPPVASHDPRISSSSTATATARAAASTGAAVLDPPTPARTPSAATSASGPSHAEDTVATLWARVIEQLDAASQQKLKRLPCPERPEPGLLRLKVPPAWSYLIDQLTAPEATSALDSAVKRVVGAGGRLVFDRDETAISPRTTAGPPGMNAEFNDDPLVRKLHELFEARPIHWEAGPEPDDDRRASEE